MISSLPSCTCPFPRASSRTLCPCRPTGPIVMSWQAARPSRGVESSLYEPRNLGGIEVEHPRFDHFAAAQPVDAHHGEIYFLPVRRVGPVPKESDDAVATVQERGVEFSLLGRLKKPPGAPEPVRVSPRALQPAVVAPIRQRVRLVDDDLGVVGVEDAGEVPFFDRPKEAAHRLHVLRRHFAPPCCRWSSQRSWSETLFAGVRYHLPPVPMGPEAPTRLAIEISIPRRFGGSCGNHGASVSIS